MFNFTPDTKEDDLEIPLFEDCRSDFAPYYGGKVSIKSAESQVASELSKLGGYIMGFHKGAFGEDEHKRYGYEVKFAYGGAFGIIQVAGLPIRNETDNRIERVRIQALLNVRDWLKSAVTMKIFAPGSDPLLPHLLLPDGETTIADYIISQGGLPEIAAPKQEIIGMSSPPITIHIEPDNEKD